MTLAYKVEELLALRDSVSESAVSIDKFADEDVIKEHVLRPSASACLIGTRVDNSSRPLAAPAAAGTTAAAKKPSPSPSIKRGKAERLLKEHGSPPGLRVTAGGRIVPSDLQPLSSARFSANSLKPQPPRVVSPGNLGPVYPPPDNNTNKVAAHTQGLFTNNGQAYLFIDNQLVPISNSYIMPSPFNTGLDGGQPTGDSMFVDPNGLGSSQPQLPVQNIPGRFPKLHLLNAAPVPAPRQHDLSELMKQHASKSQDHKQLEQIEVLRAPYENQEWRDATVEKKRKLVIEIDKLRRAIIAIDPNAFKTGTSAQSVPMAHTQIPSYPTSATQAAFAQQFQQPMHMYAPAAMPMVSPAPAMFPHGPLMMYGQPLVDAQSQSAGPIQLGATYNGVPNVMIPAAFPLPPTGAKDTMKKAQDAVHQSPTGARRSHAVEIKPPRDVPKQTNARGSTLNPQSPTYEPHKASFNVRPRGPSSFLPPSPSPRPTPQRMLSRASAESMKAPQHELKAKSSLSSVSTADFFPTNTHEHSLTKTGPIKPSLSQRVSGEELTGPTTPDKKAWGTLPLSTGGKSRFRSLFQASPTRRSSGSDVFINSPLGSQDKSRFATDSLRLSGASPSPALGTGREQSPWFFSAPRKTTNIPSTFQEGYQAGLQHAGLPMNVEVIRGFIGGLNELLRELTEKDVDAKNPTKLGTPVVNPAHDSGVSMSFKMGANAASGQENHRRMSTAVGLATPLEGLGQSPTSSMFTGSNNPIKYSLCNEAAELPKHSRISKTDSLDKANEANGTPTKDEENRSQKGQIVNALHALQHVSSYPVQLSGNQAAARGMGGLYTRQPTSAGKKESPSAAPKPRSVGPAKSAHEQRYSGFDGAMDDLQEVFEKVEMHDGAEASTEASCFKGYSSKGKQKATSSPTKSVDSHKRSVDYSPAKVKLEQIAHSIKSTKKDERDEEKLEDPSIMSPAEKRHWRENWRRRFATLANREREEIQHQEYLRSRNMNQN